MKWFYGFTLMALLILALDYGLTRYGEYRERVKREKAMRKWGLAPAFKTVKASDRWMS